MPNRIRNKGLFASIGAIVLLAVFAMSACSPSTPATAQLATLTLSSITTPTRALPSPASAQTETNTVIPTPTATATRRPVASTSAATPTTTTPAGVFVSAIKIDPMPAKSNEPPQLTVTFLNTTGQPQMYRWFVKIYVQDQPQSFGETSKIKSEITTKTSQVKASSDWKTLVVLDCMSFIARVFWADDNNQVTEFLKSDATSPATGFTVCPMP